MEFLPITFLEKNIFLLAHLAVWTFIMATILNIEDWVIRVMGFSLAFAMWLPLLIMTIKAAWIA